MGTAETGWYVYGIVGADDAGLAAGLDGIDSRHGVTCVVFDGLGAITCRVPMAEFADEPLRVRLEDIEWVERVARAHERVLDEVLEQATVIPMRMCTVYRTLDAIRAMLEREADVIHDLLQDLAGKQEWGVKAFLHPPEATSAAATTPSVPAAPAADPAGGRGGLSGTEYLMRKRAQRDRGAELERMAGEAAPEIHDRLAALASEARVNHPQRRELTGHPGTMVLNCVYLVDRDELADFRAELERLAARHAPLGLELVATGPWPPYNFLPGEAGAGW